MGWGRSLLSAAAVAVSLSLAQMADAAELVMFESAGCPWCEAWDREIGISYDKTEEGKLLPLRRVRMEEPRPHDLIHVGRIVYSPTFVAVEKGMEIGRIQGYPGADNFWWMLGNIAERLKRMQRMGFPPPPPPPPAPTIPPVMQSPPQPFMSGP